MSAQMSFVYVKATGHVLSVITTVAALKGGLTVADITSPTLIVRDIYDDEKPRKTIHEADFALKAELLDVFTGDIVDDALLNPRNYWWNSLAKEIQGLPNPDGDGLTVKATASSVMVSLKPTSRIDVPVLLAFPGSDLSKSEVPATQVIKANTKTTTFATSGLIAGTYALVLAAGYSPMISKITL